MTISRGFHDSVNNRRDRENDTKQHLPFKGALYAKVRAPDGDSERVSVETIVGEEKTPFAYPFSSKNAWIRGQPEVTTTMLTILGSDTKELTPIGYYDPTKSGTAATYRTLAAGVRQNPEATVPNRARPYRTLAPGELDIASGFAQAYFGSGDIAQLRGGLSHLVLQSMHTAVQTPLLKIEGGAHTLDGNLRDEIRFGTVRRNTTTSSPTLPALVKVEGTRRTDAPGAQTLPLFAKEFSVMLDWMGDPEKLIDHRQGIVTADDGTFPQGGPSGRNKLRAQYRWFSDGGPGNLNFTTTEIDDKGNVLAQTSKDATRGIAIAIPNGDFLMNLGENQNGQWAVTTRGDAQIETKDGARFAIVADGAFSINTSQRGEIKADGGIGIKSDGFINIDAKPGSGITLGDRSATKYPVLVANPDYLSTLSSYYSAQTTLASSIAAAAGQAAAAWSAVGPLLMLLDPSGAVMGTCLSAASGASTVASNAPQVSSAIGQHLPKLARMPSGFISAKTVSE